jgi:hypothetical protein
MSTEVQPQSPMMNAQPQTQHQWLHRLVGEWAYEHEAALEPGKPPQKFTGTGRSPYDRARQDRQVQGNHRPAER